MADRPLQTWRRSAWYTDAHATRTGFGLDAIVTDLSIPTI